MAVVKTTINEDKQSSVALESRFVATYERNKGSQAASVREMLLAGFIMRELGVSQQLVDLEKDGKFAHMTLLERRIAIAKLISLDLFDPASKDEAELDHLSKNNATPKSPSTEKVKPQIGSWGGLGS